MEILGGVGFGRGAGCIKKMPPVVAVEHSIPILFHGRVKQMEILESSEQTLQYVSV